MLECVWVCLLSEYVFSTDEAMTGAAPICVDETGKLWKEQIRCILMIIERSFFVYVVCVHYIAFEALLFEDLNFASREDLKSAWASTQPYPSSLCI